MVVYERVASIYSQLMCAVVAAMGYGQLLVALFLTNVVANSQLTPSLSLYERGSDEYAHYLWKRDELTIGNANTQWAAAPSFQTVSWILMANSVEQVSQGLRWARARRAAVTVRSGGHSYGAFSCEAPAGSSESLMVDVRALRDVSYDPKQGTVTVGPGATLGEMYAALDKHSLALPGGTCASVGVGGLLLGGGEGVLRREYGMMIDRLLQAEIVLPNGTVLTTTAESLDPEVRELFWALRGAGGGQFGVVTSLVFKPVSPGRRVNYKSEELPWNARLVQQWQDWAHRQHDGAHHSLTLKPSSSSEHTVTMVLNGLYPSLYHGVSFSTKGIKAVFNRVFKVNLEQAQEVSWLQAVGIEDGAPHNVHQGDDGPHAWTAGSGYTYNVSEASHLDRIAAHLSRAPFRGSQYNHVVNFDAFGGAIDEIPRNGTAFPHRGASAWIQYLAAKYDVGANDTDSIQEWKVKAGQWIAAMRGRVEDAVVGAYGNTPYTESGVPREDLLRSYYRENLPRLKRIKAKFDPGNTFRFAQSIQP